MPRERKPKKPGVLSSFDSRPPYPPMSLYELKELNVSEVAHVNWFYPNEKREDGEVRLRFRKRKGKNTWVMESINGWPWAVVWNLKTLDAYDRLQAQLRNWVATEL